ncbi:hypothetical protein Baya_7659 [Bagarius yarrelli]|uniref:Uncharacterized protein n=1 Tax=Bagarius yarrelli TaxID=175774 RepID=A0A556U3V5_BAGYA|nr:hypothetical protein Baya_7659 [Bagarius yarrelli]
MQRHRNIARSQLIRLNRCWGLVRSHRRKTSRYLWKRGMLELGKESLPRQELKTSGSPKDALLPQASSKDEIEAKSIGTRETAEPVSLSHVRGVLGGANFVLWLG